MAAALLLLLLLSLLISSGVAQSEVDDDAKKALLSVKLALGNNSSLSSWSESTSPCHPNGLPWTGVMCKGATIFGLRLESLNLSGFVDADALSRVKSLRTLSFANNTLSGPIPSLYQVGGLRTLFLSGNSFHGPIPIDFFAGMGSLRKLHLSGNNFSGPIPPSLSKAAMLTELALRGNRFSGGIPPLDLPSLQLLDLSDNELTGPIPAALASKFKENSFSNNSGLCGPPLTGKPCVSGGDGGKTAQIIVGIVIVVLFAVAIIVMWTGRPQPTFDRLGVDNGGAMEAGKGNGKEAVARSVSEKKAHRRGGEKGGNRTGELVMVNEGKGPALEMGDLMTAAAEMMGNGGLGAAYKAVMGDGTAVAVKRMREMGRVGKETFDVEMRKLGRLSHDNVLPPLAYHYGKDEKLLVLEYVPKGSLLFILHGDRGTDHAALDWPTRLRIIHGIAKGMVYLHAELNSHDVPHGNLKSGNVLLTSDFDPLIVDYGFVPLVNPSVASRVMFAYKSPESLAQRRVSPKSDVYSLGIIILEVLTGKFPAQYLSNANGGTDVVAWAIAATAENRVPELIDPAIIVAAKQSVPEMERLIRVGVACIEPNPDERMDVKEANRRIEEIAVDAKKAAAIAGAAPSPKDGPAVSHESLVRGVSGNQSKRRAGNTADTSRDAG